jgi:type I restriction enzyme S subunit
MTYGISDSGTEDGTIRVLTMGHIKDGQISVPTHGGVSIINPELLLQPNDLLFNRTNSAAHVGKVGLFTGSDGPVTFASYLVRLRPTKDNDAEFLNLLLNDSSVLSLARREAIPSLHQSNLNPTRYGRLRVAIPELSEQREIVRFVKRATAHIEDAINRTQCAIGLLGEYRTRLIADVVTGKVDVRAASARLQDETDERDPTGGSDVDVEDKDDSDLDALVPVEA